MYIEKGGEMKKGGPGNLRGDLRPLMKPYCYMGINTSIKNLFTKSV